MARTVLLYICILIAATALYAADPEGNRWYIGIEGSAVRPGNDDLILGTPVSSATGGPNGKLATLDYGTAPAYAFKFGYETPRSDCYLRVWWYSQDADTTVVWPNGLLPAFENPLFGDTFATRLDGKATLEATIEDVVWARKMGADEKWRWDFSIGLRGSRVDQESTMTDDAASLFVFDDQVVMHSEATGIGVVGGIGGRYDFTEWMWGSASFRMAFLTGTLDVSRSETAFGVPLFTKLDCARRVFRQSELDIRLNFRVQKHVALFVGYEFKQFDESTARILVTDDVADGNVAVDRSDLAFSGFSGGAVFAF